MSNTYVIAEATTEDLEDLCYMVRQFHLDSPYAHIPWEADTIRRYITALMDTGLVCVLKDTDGYCYGTIGFEWGALPFNEHYYVYVEKWFYVKPDLRNSGAGVQLIQWAENEIKERDDAYLVVLSTLSNSPDHVPKWYGTKGYAWAESSYMKEVH